jgi:hypothetical protein
MMGADIVADRPMETIRLPSALMVGVRLSDLQRNASYTFCS